ncbi:MAG: glycosyltransferase family 39 protein [Nitrososphaerales archaeon]
MTNWKWLLKSKKNASTYAILALALPLAVYCVTLGSSGGQEANIVAVQSAILNNHSLSIQFNWFDTVQFAGENYSVYAPGYALLSLPFAAAGFFIDGSATGFATHAILMDELLLSIAASLSALLVYKICLFYTRFQSVALLIAFTLTLATSIWPFGVEVFPHDLSMMFALLSVYLVLTYTRTRSRPMSLLGMAGLGLGVGTLVEYAAALFIAPLLVYLVAKRREEGSRSSVSRVLNSGPISFLASFIASGVGLNLLYNYALFGDPLLFPQQLYYNGIHFLLGSLAYHILLNLISPYRGLFLFSPVLLLGFYGLYRMSLSIAWRADAILFMSLFSLILVYYSAWQGWDGGAAYGPRFLVLGLPYLVIPITVFLSEKWSKIARSVFLALFVLSSFIAGLGAFAGTPPSNTQDVFTYQPTSFGISQILQGKLAVWWIQMLPSADTLTIYISLGLVFAFIWLIASYLSLRNLPNSRKVAFFDPKRTVSGQSDEHGGGRVNNVVREGGLPAIALPTSTVDLTSK